MALAQYFLQNLTINGQPITREDVLTCNYMEMEDLEGPQIEVTIRDTTGRLVDNLGIKYGSTLVATMGDPEGQLALWQDTFFVVEAPARNDAILVIALLDAVRKLHAPAPKAQFFKDAQPADILTALTGGSLAPVADAFKLTGTWHLNNGEEPVNVVRRMARDNGAAAWVSKSRISVKAINGLLNTAPAFTYEANNPKAPYRINKFQILNADYAASSAHDYRYVGFSQTEGQQSAGGDGVPVRMVADSDQNVLQNRLIGLIPKLDMEIDGNAGLGVGDLIGIKIHRYDETNALNEAIPPYLVVMRVTHYETRFNYRCRVILGTTYEQLKGLDGMDGGGALGGAKAFTGPDGFNIDGFDMGGFLDKISQGVDVTFDTINDAIAMVNHAEQTIRDTAGNVIKITQDAIGNVIRETTDAAGNVIKETTDKAGNVVKEIIKDVTGIGSKPGGGSGTPPASGGNP
ncbi:TPA: hypothetical protein JG832_002516 [Enterobacter hormaechei subsp. xiangfangensis]|nr:hypothetical protein [Enterobacter hormaechei subsp. xiangfangensis]HAV1890651.1 hypothetical protein [Enterobacter hormaechei subsp. xiangfangensis]